MLERAQHSPSLASPSSCTLGAQVISAQTALRDLPLHQVVEAIGAERAEAVTLLMLAIDDIPTRPARRRRVCSEEEDRCRAS